MDFPLGLGNRLTFVVHKPLAVSEYDFAELMEETESEVVKGINFNLNKMSTKYKIRGYAVFRKDVDNYVDQF
jgi:hypothetical protein